MRLIWEGKKVILVERFENNFELFLKEKSGLSFIGKLSNRSEKEAIFTAKNFFDNKDFITW